MELGTQRGACRRQPLVSYDPPLPQALFLALLHAAVIFMQGRGTVARQRSPARPQQRLFPSGSPAPLAVGQAAMQQGRGGPSRPALPAAPATMPLQRPPWQRRWRQRNRLPAPVLPALARASL